MTIHPDSLKPMAPGSYFCEHCQYRHNKGSIRYQDHWKFRQVEQAATSQPAPVKKARRHG